MLLTACLGACQSCPPEVRARVAARDFSDPTIAGRTFLAAVACDDPLVEYLALAESFKARHSATYDAYRLFRPELREELGRAVGLAWRLEPVEAAAGEEGVLVWWGHRGRRVVGFQMVAQDYFSLRAGGRELSAFLPGPLAEALTVEGKRLQLSLEDPALRGLSPGQVSHLVAATEWKIGDVRTPEEESR